jgi:hypothetical protein
MVTDKVFRRLLFKVTAEHDPTATMMVRGRTAYLVRRSVETKGETVMDSRRTWGPIGLLAGLEASAGLIRYRTTARPRRCFGAVA